MDTTREPAAAPASRLQPVDSMPTRQWNSRHHTLPAIVICWQVSACEKAEQWPDRPAEVLGVTAAAFPPGTDLIAGCELDPARPDRLRKMLADQVADPTARCGFNPIDRIRSVVIGFDEAGRTGIIAVRGIGRRELTTCLDKLGNQPVDEGHLTRVTLKGKPDWFGWMSDDVFIVAVRSQPDGSMSLDRAIVEERTGGARGLAADAAILRMLDPRHGAQCTFASTSMGLASDLGAPFTGVTAAYGRMRHVDRPDRDVGLAFDEVDANVTFRFATAAQGEAAARALPDLMTEYARGLAPAEALAVLVDMAEIAHSGTEVRVHLKVDRPGFERIGQAMSTAGGHAAPR